jgi:hypothetical protein
VNSADKRIARKHIGGYNYHGELTGYVILGVNLVVKRGRNGNLDCLVKLETEESKQL